MKRHYKVAVLVFLCLFAIGSAAFIRHTHNQTAALVGDEFKGISVAMQNHISAHQSLPPAVTWSNEEPRIPLTSWRLNISSFLSGWGGRSSVARNQRWDSKYNSQFHDMRLSPSLATSNKYSNNFARIYAITGEGTAFGPSNSASTDWHPEDFPPDTIIAIEVAGPDKHWMEPGDYDIKTIQEYAVAKNGMLLAGEVSDRVHVIFADFEVWALSSKTPFSEFRKFLTTTGASKYSREKLLSPHCIAIVR